MTTEEAIKILERAESYAGIRYINGVETPYVTPCLLKAIDFALAALRAQQEAKNLWHDAKTNPPKDPGLYYGRKDATNSMWLCRYRDGVWVLDMYPEQEMPIVQWAEYASLLSEEQPEIVAEMNEQKGLFGKYIVRKASDGTPIDNCFVLRPDKDPAAVTAIRAYAEATDNSFLADDLLQWVGEEKPLTLEELREMDRSSPPIWDSSLNEWCEVRRSVNGFAVAVYIGGGSRPLEANRFYRHKPKEGPKC